MFLTLSLGTGFLKSRLKYNLGLQTGTKTCIIGLLWRIFVTDLAKLEIVFESNTNIEIFF